MPRSNKSRLGGVIAPILAVFLTVYATASPTRNVTAKSWLRPRNWKKNVRAIWIDIVDAFTYHTQLLPSRLEDGLIQRGFLKGAKSRLVEGVQKGWDRGYFRDLVEARPIYEKVQKKLAKKAAAKCATGVGG